VDSLKSGQTEIPNRVKSGRADSDDGNLGHADNAQLKLILILAVLLFAGTFLQAKEGADQYANGAENWFTGALPPAGWYYINYFGYYTGELRDGAGDKVNVEDRRRR